MKRLMISGMLAGAAISVMTSPSKVVAATISLLPSKSNFVSNTFPGNSDGAGYHFFVGGGRESLLQFDFSSIPVGATITSANLAMYMDRSQVSSPPTQPIFIYRLTSSWGMGTSGAGQIDNGIVGAGGQGYVPTNNDATWNYRFYNASSPASSIAWTTAGGDYASSASAYSLVGSGFPTTGTQGPGGPILSTWSGTGLVSDIQNWITGAQPNDGWLLNDYASSADYGPSGSTFGSIQPRRFISQYNNLDGTAGTSDDRPYLTITYSVPEPGSLVVIAVGGLMLQFRRRKV